MIMTYKKMLFISITISFAIFIIPQITSAQVDNAGSYSSDLSIPAQVPELQEQISVDVSPEVPAPNETVTISVEAYGTDLNRAPITWSVNGKTVLTGLGEKVLKFNTGSVGTVSKIHLNIKPIGGGPDINKDFEFAPGDVDVIWEAATYTPPFYKGKALYTPEALVNFYAVPNLIDNGSRVPTNKAVYKWTVDTTVDGDNSGFGKNTYSIVGPIIQGTNNITVDAYSSTNSAVKGTGFTHITPTTPESLIYENNSIYGILFNSAVTNQYLLTKDDVKLDSFPLYFSTQNKNTNVTYDWNIDGNKVNVPLNQNSVIFKKSGKSGDSASITLTVGNPNKILQIAQNAISLMIGSQNTNFFGN